MLTCFYCVYQEISPGVGGALFPRVICMPEEGRVFFFLRHFEFLSLKSGPRENVENPQVLMCNFLMLN